MAETENAPAEGEKKKGSKLFLIIGLVLVLAIGGGAGYYFFVMSAADKDGDEKAEKKKKKKDKEEPDDSNELELKSSKTEDSEDDEESSDGSVKISLPDDEDVKSVIELKPFVVNLVDTDEPKYLRLTVSLGIGGDEGGGGGHEPDELFLTKVKNAMLSVLATKSSDDVLSVKGKALLRKQLLKAAQAAAEDGHIEAIYITDFIVQL